MAHTLPIHLDRMERALRSAGVNIKRTKVMEVAAAAFGYRSANALAAASRAGELDPPKAERISTMQVPGDAILHVLRDPAADRLFGMQAETTTSRADDIGVTPYGNLVALPRLPATADDATPSRVVLWFGQVTGSHGVAGNFCGHTRDEYQRDLAAWCREHWSTVDDQPAPPYEHKTDAQVIAAFFDWNEEYELSEKIVSEPGERVKNPANADGATIWVTIVSSAWGVDHRSFERSKAEADKKLATWCLSQGDDGFRTALAARGTDEKVIQGYFVARTDQDLHQEAVIVDGDDRSTDGIEADKLRSIVDDLEATVDDAVKHNDLELLSDSRLHDAIAQLRALLPDHEKRDDEDRKAIAEGWRLERGIVCVELTDLGEGEDGEFDATDPHDKPYLRFDVSVRQGKEWEAVDDASYCVTFEVSSPIEIRKALLEAIMGEVHDPVTAGHPVKRLCERLSWLTPADVMPKAAETTPDAGIESPPAPTSDARLTVLVRFCERDGNGEVLDCHEADLDVTDRFLALSAKEMRKLAKGDDALTEALVANRVELDGTRWEGPVEAWVNDDAILDFFAENGWQIRSMAAEDFDHQLADFLQAKAGWISSVTAELERAQASIRIDTALSAMRDLTDADLDEAIRQERERRANRSGFAKRLRERNPGVVG